MHQSSNLILAPIPSIDQLFLKVSPRLPLTLLMGLWRQPTDIAVLFWFMVIAGTDVKPHLPGWIKAPHAMLSEDLRLDRRNLCRSVNRLANDNVLEQLARRETIYRVSPQLATKGSADELAKTYSSTDKDALDPAGYVVIPREKTRQQIRDMLEQCESYRVKKAERYGDDAEEDEPEPEQAPLVVQRMRRKVV